VVLTIGDIIAAGERRVTPAVTVLGY